MKPVTRKLIVFLAALVCAVLLAGGITAYLDPFMVYHAPQEEFYYELDNARYQNRGILTYYDYDALITGTSITQNFSSDQMDELFGVTTVRVPIPGATFHEIAEQLDLAAGTGHTLTMALISLDLNHLIEDKEALRTDLGIYPEYLSNDNPFDDVKYLFNRDVMLEYCIPMIVRWLQGEEGGATPMEEYYRMSVSSGGADVILSDRTEFVLAEVSELSGLTEEERTLTQENIEENILRVARENPDTLYIYFTAPYSVAWWGNLYEEGDILKYLEAEELAFEMMLEEDNIQIYCYTNRWDIAENLDLYGDYIHYVSDINDMILEDIASGTSDVLLTSENYMEFIEEQREFLLDYDYNALFDQ